VAYRSKAWISGLSFSGIVDSNSAGYIHRCLSVVSVASWQVEVSAMGLSLVQRSPTEYGVSECDRETSIIRRSLPTRGLLRHGKK